jgi:hypothetical protein
MVAASSAMRATSATYSSLRPGRSLERNTVTIMEGLLKPMRHCATGGRVDPIEFGDGGHRLQ